MLGHTLADLLIGMRSRARMTSSLEEPISLAPYIALYYSPFYSMSRRCDLSLYNGVTYVGAPTVEGVDLARHFGTLVKQW